jgi:threonine synthase
MQFYSTKQQSPNVDLKTAVLQGLPKDNGLYMPEVINKMPPNFWDNINNLSFAEMAFEVANCLLKGSMPANDLRQIVNEAVNFDAPLVPISKQLTCLELFHGPSLAFKDFGARFMARLMSYLLKGSNQKLYILVATSGDTGGAVAQGFLHTKNIEVIILYPSQKISLLQEKQLTTLGANITALEIKGTFDDCQKLVKTAFLDDELQQKLNLSSANSINIARLVPQTFYYVYAYAQAKKMGYKKVVFSVPSGNFGNLCAGLIAKEMGMPSCRFVAANNANDVFTEYYNSTVFTPRASVKTLSNAMDVGNPSNFQRIQDLYKDIEAVRAFIQAYSYTDEETLTAIKEIYKRYNYVVCPHTAVAYLGLKAYQKAFPTTDELGVFLATAHPSKFLDIVEPALDITVPIPESLQILANRPKVSQLMSTNFTDFKAYLMDLG